MAEKVCNSIYSYLNTWKKYKIINGKSMPMKPKKGKTVSNLETK